MQTFETRVIYNSTFTQTELFDANVRKNLCNLPLVRKKLYSDVAKNIPSQNVKCLQKGAGNFIGTKPCVSTREQNYLVSKSYRKHQKKTSVHIGKIAKFGSFKLKTENRFQVLQNHTDTVEWQTENTVQINNTVT